MINSENVAKLVLASVLILSNIFLLFLKVGGNEAAVDESSRMSVPKAVAAAGSWKCVLNKLLSKIIQMISVKETHHFKHLNILKRCINHYFCL